jgi:hypothetical protein
VAASRLATHYTNINESNNYFTIHMQIYTQQDHTVKTSLTSSMVWPRRVVFPLVSDDDKDRLTVRNATVAM